jgi:hypothetical protein
MLPGDTDYTGVDLNDILHDLRDWHDALDETIIALGNIRVRLAAREGSPESRDGLNYIDFFRDLFGRYKNDIARLLSELPSGVLPRHVEIVRQIYESSRVEEEFCVTFKRRHYLDALPSDYDRVEHLLADIYAQTRDELINLRDLGNVMRRLETYVDHAPSIRHPAGTAVNALELKPNVFGIGINVNYIWERWGPPAWKRSRRDK